MSQRIVYFIEKDNVRKYKCDTFWTMSEKIENAKIHSDGDHERFFQSYLDTLIILRNRKNTHEHIKEKVIGEIFGYCILDENNFPISVNYLKIITDIIGLDEIKFDDYKKILRNNK